MSLDRKWCTECWTSLFWAKSWQNFAILSLASSDSNFSMNAWRVCSLCLWSWWWSVERLGVERFMLLLWSISRVFLLFQIFIFWFHEFFFYFQFFREMVSHVKLKVMRNEKSKPRWPSRAWYSQPLAASSLLDVLGNSMTLIATGSSLSKNDDGGRKIDNNLKEGVNYNWGKVKMMSIVTKIYISHNYCTQLLNVFFFEIINSDSKSFQKRKHLKFTVLFWYTVW